MRDLNPSPQTPTQYLSTPTQAPDWQVVLARQESVVLQEVPLALILSAGQLSDDPVQYSAGSQNGLKGSVEGLQTTEELEILSTGQEALFPGQLSAISQSPRAGRQTVLVGAKWQEASQHPLFGGSQSSTG
jgi:hypothetical protein